MTALTDTQKETERNTENGIKDAVFAVGDYTKETQMQALRNATKAAPLNVMDTVDKATAAACVYGRNQRKDGERNITVHELEDDSSNVTILTTDKNTMKIRIRATAGHDNKEILDFCKREFKKRTQASF